MPVVHYTNLLSQSLIPSLYSMNKRAGKRRKQSVRESTVQLEDWDMGWMNELENGKHWLLYIFICSTFIIECPHIVAGQSLTCLKYSQRTSQWLLSLKGINRGSSAEGRTFRNKEAEEEGVWGFLPRPAGAAGIFTDETVSTQCLHSNSECRQEVTAALLGLSLFLDELLSCTLRRRTETRSWTQSTEKEGQGRKWL